MRWIALTLALASLTPWAARAQDAQDAPASADEGATGTAGNVDVAEAGPASDTSEPDADAVTDADEVTAPDEVTDTDAVTDTTEMDAAHEAVPAPEGPKVAVVVIGDPDERLRRLARRVDDALEPAGLRRPFDPGLRAAMRGEAGEGDDGLGEVRRERRRLGLGERSDAPVLSALGRRAGALVVAAVRASDDGPELLVLDVSRGSFYEGELALSATSPTRIGEFVSRRARAASRRPPAPDEAARVAAAAIPDETSPLEGSSDDEPDLFEQIWPYLVAGVLLAGMLTAIAITAANDSSPQPMLRFVPGGG